LTTKDSRAADTLSALAYLFERAGHSGWLDFVTAHRDQALESGINPDILHAYGAMGSFSDVMLTPREQDPLDDLQGPWGNRLLDALRARISILANEASGVETGSFFDTADEPPVSGWRCLSCGHGEITDLDIEAWVAAVLVPKHVGDATLERWQDLVDEVLDRRIPGAEDARADLKGRAAAAGLAVTSRHGNMCPCRACDSADTARYRWTLAPWGFHPAENNLELRGPDFRHRPESDVSAVIALLHERGATPVADGLWEAIWRQDHELAAAQVEVLECLRGLDQSVFLRIYEDVEWSASNGGWRRRGEHTWQLPPSASTRLLVPSTLAKGVWQLYVAARALPDEAWIDLFKDAPRTALAILRRHEVVALVDAGYESVEWRVAVLPPTKSA
jgi:hypothetical protein